MEKQKWFALTAGGNIKSLGECADFEEADSKTESAIWVFSMETAREWVDSIQNELEK